MALSLVIGVSLTWILSRPTRNYFTRPLENWRLDRPEFAAPNVHCGGVPFVRQSRPDGSTLHTLTLFTTAPLPGEPLRSIDLQFDVLKGDEFQTGPPTVAQLTSATLEDRSHLFSSGTTRKIWSEALVELPLREPAKKKALELSNAPAAASSPEAQMLHASNTNWTLRVVTAEPVNLRLRAHIVGIVPDQVPNTNLGIFCVTLPPLLNGEERVAYVHGRTTHATQVPAVTRASLLAWTWAWSSASPVWWLVIGVTFLAGASVAILPLGSASNGAPIGRRIAGGTAGLFAVWALLQIVLSPPLGGQDETLHFSSYHQSRQDPSAQSETLVLGRRVHTERLFARQHQILTADDRRQAWTWDDPPSSDSTARTSEHSPITSRIWALTQSLAVGQSATRQLLRLRCLGVLALTAAIAFAAVILGSSGQPGNYRTWMGWTPLLIPALPYYAAAVSSTAFLLAELLVIAATLTALVHSQTRPAWFGAVIGTVVGLAWHTSESAFPLIALIAPMLVILALEAQWQRPTETIDGVSSRTSRRMNSRNFWALLAAGLLLTRLATTAEFEAANRAHLALITSRIAWLPLPYYPVVTVTVVGCLFLLERWSIGIAKKRASARRQESRSRVTQLSTALAFGLSALVLWNSVTTHHQLPHLPNSGTLGEFIPNQGSPLPPSNEPITGSVFLERGPYLKHIFLSVLSSFGVDDQDYLASRSFWQLRGPDDVTGPVWIGGGLSCLFLLGLAWQGRRLAQTGDSPRSWRLGAALIGLVGYLALLGLANRSAQTFPQLPGQYLAGFYFGLLTLGWVGWKGPLLRSLERFPRSTLTALVILPSAIQLSAIAAQLNRLF